MKIDNLHGFKSIDKFVEYKLNRLESGDKNFETLFELMFSEKENVLFEKTEGYKIKKITYGESEKNALRRAETLADKLNGVEKGGTVGLYMQNSFEWVEMLWAILIAGYNPLLINMRIPLETLNGVLKNNGVKAVISDGTAFEVKTLLASEITLSGKEKKIENFGTEISVMSSGTSYNVKICTYSAEQFYYQIKDSFSLIKENSIVKRHYNGELKLLTFLPFYHIFGLVAVYVWFTFFSRTLVLLNDLNPKTITGTIKRHKVTHIFAIPLFWEKVYGEAIKKIKERGDKTYNKFLKGLELSEKPIIGKLVTKKGMQEIRDNLFGDSVRFMITGGSGINGEVLKFFNAVGYPLSNGYGMSEIGITSVELSKSKKILNGGSVGKPLNSVEYKIENGTLFVKSKASAKYVVDGNGKKPVCGEWFNTSDLAEEKEGRYFILGRADDVVISSTGENLNPNLIEDKFNIKGVKGVCLTSLKKGESSLPVLVVSVAEFLKKARLEEIDKEVKNTLVELKILAEISELIYTTDLLMTGEEFKLNRTKIKKELEAGKINRLSFESVTALEVDEKLVEEIKIEIASTLGKEVSELKAHGDFFIDEGGTSLDYYLLTSNLQSKFDITLPSAEEERLSTAEAIAKYLSEKL